MDERKNKLNVQKLFDLCSLDITTLKSVRETLFLAVKQYALSENREVLVTRYNKSQI